MMGSSVLPLSSAFATTGIVSAFTLMAIILIANNHTAHMLLYQSYKVGTVDYESLGYAIGGPFWKFITELSIVILMLGTLIGGIAQVGECFSSGLLFVSSPPGFFVDNGGRWILLIATVVIVAPLCFMKNLTALDVAGVIGFCVVMFMTFWIMGVSISMGLPAVPNKGLSNVGFDVGISAIGSAMSIFGFVYFIQPIMMAMVQEMPDGVYGMRILGYATSASIFGPGVIIYGMLGFFGAAAYGADTEGNVLNNKWGNKYVQVCLNLAIAMYLALSLPAVVYPTRMAMNQWLPGRKDRHKLLRKAILITIILGFMVTIAMLWPDQSATFLTITGATGVLLTSYLLPVINHFMLYFGWARCQRAEGLHRWPTHPYWQRNGSEEANIIFTPKMDGVAPLQMEVRSTRSTGVKSHYGTTNPEMTDSARSHQNPKEFVRHSFVGVATARTHIIEDHSEDEVIDDSTKKVLAAEHGFAPGDVQYRPCDKMWYRKQYRFKVVELVIEILVPLAVVGIGFFASITALKTVSFTDI